VDARGPLGDLAKLASDLADRYRWRPSEAATFVLTGRTPEVLVYVGSAQIRPGQTNVMSRVTMTLDPALTPEQVAGIYSRLKARFRPTPGPRSLSVKHCRLAQQSDPTWPSASCRLANGLASDAHRAPARLGSSRSSSPFPVTPGRASSVSGTRKYEQWRYESVSNFNRDAKNALNRLLWLGWTTRAGNQEL
jgi:hypothetical protein